MKSYGLIHLTIRSTFKVHSNTHKKSIMTRALVNNKKVDTHIRREVANALPNLSPDEQEKEIRKAKAAILSGNGQYAGMMDNALEDAGLSQAQKNLLASKTRGVTARDRLRKKLEQRRKEQEECRERESLQCLIDLGIRIRAIEPEHMIECMNDPNAGVVSPAPQITCGAGDDVSVEGLVSDLLFSKKITIREKRGKRARSIRYIGLIRLLYAASIKSESPDITAKPHQGFFDMRSNVNMIDSNAVIQSLREYNSTFYFNNRYLSYDEFLDMIGSTLKDQYRALIESIFTECPEKVTPGYYVAIIAREPSLRPLLTRLQALSMRE